MPHLQKCQYVGYIQHQHFLPCQFRKAFWLSKYLCAWLVQPAGASCRAWQLMHRCHLLFRTSNVLGGESIFKYSVFFNDASWRATASSAYVSYLCIFCLSVYLFIYCFVRFPMGAIFVVETVSGICTLIALGLYEELAQIGKNGFTEEKKKCQWQAQTVHFSGLFLWSTSKSPSFRLEVQQCLGLCSTSSRPASPERRLVLFLVWKRAEELLQKRASHLGREMLQCTLQQRLFSDSLIAVFACR